MPLRFVDLLIVLAKPSAISHKDLSRFHVMELQWRLLKLTPIFLILKMNKIRIRRSRRSRRRRLKLVKMRLNTKVS
jgi:hypothetical protein